MPFVLFLLVAIVVAIVAGTLVDRALRLPNAVARRRFHARFRGLPASWLIVFAGFFCSQPVYGAVTHGKFALDPRDDPVTGWLLLALVSFAAALGSWWGRRSRTER